MRNKTWITSTHQGFVDENLHPNTFSRMTKDGVLIVNYEFKQIKKILIDISGTIYIGNR